MRFFGIVSPAPTEALSPAPDKRLKLYMRFMSKTSMSVKISVFLLGIIIYFYFMT
jgi:hypothetical protein